MYYKGNIPWNKGLTKEKDERVKKYCQNLSKTRLRLFKEEKLKVWNKNVPHSEKTKIKMSKNHWSKKGIKPWNKGKSGLQKHTEEWKKQNSLRFKNKKRLPFSEETKKKMSLSRIGIVPWNRGKKGILAGNLSPHWKGGISFEPYDSRFNKELKEQIKKRDGYRCQECFRHQNELKKPLNIHHIDFNKLNSNPNNLICLCNSCHSKTNYKRENWIKHYQEVIKNFS